jgi:Xaa-Pro aminopeptidase
LPEFEQRRQSVVNRLANLKADAKVEALLVSSPANVHYLTGFTGSNGLLLLTPAESHFFTDPRYALVAQANVSSIVHVAKGPLLLEAAKTITRKQLRKIGFDPSAMNVEQYEQLRKQLGSRASLRPTGGIVEELRSIKSTGEILRIRKSVMINSEAYYRTLKRFKVGMREQEIAAELDFQMRVLGAEKPAFETIVAGGPNSALPHAHPGPRRVEANELLLVDMGATADGYTSDMTRVSFTGTPSKKIRDMYQAVLDAQLAAIDTVKAGATTAKVDGAARKVLRDHKLEKEFVHSTGHGLGLEIHESPRIGRKDKTKLQAGMVITIEPGVYLDGLGGVRIEDTVLVTEQGCEVLTPTPKEFVYLG